MTDTPLQATVTQRGVLFRNDGQVLVVRRESDGGWELPGGRLDRHEDTLDGLRREIVEETTLNPNIITPVHTVAWRNDADNGRFAVYYYCSVSDSSVELSPEHDAYDWKSVSNVRICLSDPQETAVTVADDLHRSTSEET